MTPTGQGRPFDMRIAAMDRRGEERPNISESGTRDSEKGSWAPASIDPSIGFLERFGIARPALQAATRRALSYGSLAADELIAAGVITRQLYYRAIGLQFGIPYATPDNPRKLRLPSVPPDLLLREPGIVLTETPSGETLAHVAPSPRHIARLPDYMRRWPRLAERLRICEPGAMRSVLLERVSDDLADLASEKLARRHPGLSARLVSTGSQGFLSGVLFTLLLLILLIETGLTVLLAHLVASLFFLASTGLRASAAIGRSAPPPQQTELPAGPPPFYTVLVALHHEAEVAHELVDAMKRLRWPRSRIEFKLACEADDRATIAALEAAGLDERFEIVEVPAIGPRTKPKALNYALPLARGELVVLYDAEDRPDPHQLIEAWAAFHTGGERLACVQAPLSIANASEGILPSLFAIEYAALFNGLLPWLAARDLVFPLGGTSNHFRRSALEEVGGWDPYNVTEDADLGIRLHRFGYRTAVLRRPTLEDAPTTFAVWKSQRTRWYKGWLQTWLVHIRTPRSMLRDMGLRSFVAAQVLLAAMVFSVLLHPLMLWSVVTISIEALASGVISPVKRILLAIDLLNISLAYGGYGLLALRTWPRRAGVSRWLLLLVPVYWMMMSVAGWRAVWQLWRAPHLWEKTPHRPQFRGASRISSQT